MKRKALLVAAADVRTNGYWTQLLWGCIVSDHNACAKIFITCVCAVGFAADLFVAGQTSRLLTLQARA